MARNVFSVPIFFIVFRETLEAAIIISVLLGLVEQIVHDDPGALVPGALPPAAAAAPGTPGDEKERPPLEKAGSSENGDALSAQPQLTSGAGEEPQPDTKRLLRKMRLYIFAGAFLGLFLALAIGAAFIAVWFTQASDLWAKSEELWEGGLPSVHVRLRTLLIAWHRYLRACRVAHHLRHGHQYAQDGPREGQVARQAAACIQRTQ